MFNLFGRIAAAQAGQPADPLAPPQNRNDPRITAAERGYHSHCWLWRDPATADAARMRVWEERHKREARLLVNKCGHPRCVRLTHLDSIGRERYEQLQEILDTVQSAGGGRAGVAAAYRLIRDFSILMEGMGDWDKPPWPLLLDVSAYDFSAGMDEGQQAYRELLRQRTAAARQPDPAPAAPEAAPTPAMPEADPAPSAPEAAPTPAASEADSTSSASEAAPVFDSGEPPLPPLPPPPPPSGPLGNPTNLEAQPGDAPGKVVLTWTPAANATMQRVACRLDSLDGQGYYFDSDLPGDLGKATLSQVPLAGRWHFIIIAGQQASDGAVTWSEWSNWAAITVS